MEDEEKGRKHLKRLFADVQREKCWKQAKEVKGRDSERWRMDKVGNPVLKVLNGCHGVFCYEFDHIFPYSHGGKTCTKNCQLLQTAVNRYKKDLVLSESELKPASLSISCSEMELDVIERAVYGNVKGSR